MSITNSVDLSGLSKQYASRDLASHTKLKYRDIGQGAPEEHKHKDRKDLKKDLDERERISSKSTNKRAIQLESNASSKDVKKSKVEAIQHNLDADEPIMFNASDSESDEDNAGNNSDQEDEDDDTAELLAELERIKKERANEQARLEAERKKEEERIRVENILKGNPLLNPNKPSGVVAEFKVKRRWDDDVVFKNCAKSDEKNEKKAFINDTLRSEFHKKFMERYVK